MTRATTTVLRANGLQFTAQTLGEGPLVLCLHGFPDQAGTFRMQLPVLAAAGYRALAPSMRGYEPSSQPENGDYHVIRMAEDVLGWLDDLGEARVHLVGHDWGAVIAYVVAALAPDRLHTLTTLAIPHPGRLLRTGLLRLPSQLRKSWYIFFFQFRGLADWAIARNDWDLIERLWRNWSPGWELPPHELALVKATLARPGVAKAALAYYRAAFQPFSKASRQSLKLSNRKIQVPTLALTGALDGCIDTRLFDLTMLREDFPMGLRVERIEGAGHFLHQEKPDEVNQLLLEWLARREATNT